MLQQASIVVTGLDDAAVVELRGYEAMHVLPKWQVTVCSPDPAADLQALAGEEASLTLMDDLGGHRTVALMVTAARYAGHHPDGARYNLKLSSPLWGLTLRPGYAVFRRQTSADIIADVLRRANLPADVLQLRLCGAYPQHGYTVQYDESDWAFITRLLREDGIASFFDYDGEQASLVLTDYPGGHRPIDGERLLRFVDASGMQPSASNIFALAHTYQRAAAAVHLRDDDVLQPDVAISASAGGGYAEVYEYPARVPNGDAAKARAQIRLEQWRRDAVIADAKTRCARLSPGRTLSIDGAADTAHTGDYLVVAVTHTLQRAAGKSADHTPPPTTGEAARRVPDGAARQATDASVAKVTRETRSNSRYLASARLMPFDGTRSYRPAPPRGTVDGSARTSMPRIGGVVSAVVTGPSGEEIHVDGLGRIKARAAFDGSERDDDDSSDWIRCLQPNLAGSMLLPRVGWEVPLVYREGNPDEPVCLGRLYNGAQSPPYELPANKATGTMQSATSPSDGTCNEIRFADDSGRQSMMLHASRDHSVAVGGDAVVEVAGDHVIDAAVALKTDIRGSQSITIAANHSVTASAAMATKVDGARAVAVGGGEHIGTDLSRVEVVAGAYSESIAGISHTRCNAAITSVTGALSQTIGAACIVGAGCGTNELVGGARIESVGGARSIKCGAASETAVGLHRTSAAAATFSAGSALVMTAKAAMTVKAATSSLKAAGTLLLEAPSIAIAAGAAIINAGATFKLGGGHATSGATVTVKSPSTTHAGGTKASS